MNEDKESSNKSAPRRRRVAAAGSALNWLAIIVLVIAIGISLSSRR